MLTLKQLMHDVNEFKILATSVTNKITINEPFLTANVLQKFSIALLFSELKTELFGLYVLFSQA